MDANYLGNQGCKRRPTFIFCYHGNTLAVMPLTPNDPPLLFFYFSLDATLRLQARMARCLTITATFISNA